MSLFKIIFRRRRIRIGGIRKNRAGYLKHKETARGLVMGRIEYFSELYDFKFNRVSIKNTKSQWGSCSKKGNLNFNYRIALLPSPLADYLVVHELCHLKEFNHSSRFWELVAVAVPDYKILKKQLREVKFL